MVCHKTVWNDSREVSEKTMPRTVAQGRVWKKTIGGDRGSAGDGLGGNGGW